MTEERPEWLIVEPRAAPLIVSIPHAGVELREYEPRFASPWLAQKDADWRLDELYDFAGGLGATVVRTNASRSIIDVNRDPSGASLYPGQATTGLCPTTTFDGEALYREGEAPDEAEIVRRKRAYFEPYHAALRVEIARLKSASRPRRSLRRAFDPLTDPAPVRGRAAGLQSRHEFGRELQPRPARSG